MSVNNGFEAYKIAREIRRAGVAFEFSRNSLNEFGEPDASAVSVVGTIKGLYHEQSGYSQVSVSEGVQYRTKKIPMLLCLYDEVKELKLQAGDFAIVDGRRYTITNVLNLYNWGIIADLSLEVADYG